MTLNTYRFLRGLYASHYVVRQMQILLGIEYALRNFHVSISRQKSVDDHVFDSFCSFVIVNDLVKLEPGCTKLVDLVCILDIVADLIVEDAG